MNSQQSVLQVKQLSLTGEVLNTVNCFSGQVSVLRAAADDMLMPYRNALSGLGGGGKFSVLLNGEEFKPEDKHLIGFGGDVVLEGTVGSLVEQAGIPVAQLASFGLDEFVERDFQDLRSCPRRRIALLLKLFSREKVLIMDNPFEPISSRWKERFAEAVISSVEDTQSIYVVPRLSYRPQCWVGNRVIARIEVGKSIQKTIGFGTTSDDTNTMVQQVRDLVKDEALVCLLYTSDAADDA